MNIEFYQIDAFASEVFKGNPAGVCPLKEWLADDVMQNIAFENNLSETAFYVKNSDGFDIRFFTPTTEIDLCGHATLATSFVEFELKNNNSTFLNLNSKGGKLQITKQNEQITLDFPINNFTEIPLSKELKKPFLVEPVEAFSTAGHAVLVFKDSNSIENLKFDLLKIKELNVKGVCVTAQGKNYDFVSRFFAPKIGIDEDPVTGFAHTFLTPLWAAKLKKEKMTAKQVSPRGGELICQLNENRVLISGKAQLYLKGEITL